MCFLCRSLVKTRLNIEMVEIYLFTPILPPGFQMLILINPSSFINVPHRASVTPPCSFQDDENERFYDWIDTQGTGNAELDLCVSN